jgi:hypothetical protein
MTPIKLNLFHVSYYATRKGEWERHPIGNFSKEDLASTLFSFREPTTRSLVPKLHYAVFINEKTYIVHDSNIIYKQQLPIK